MADTASGVLFAAKRRCSVDGSEFGQKKKKGEGDYSRRRVVQR